MKLRSEDRFCGLSRAHSARSGFLTPPQYQCRGVFVINITFLLLLSRLRGIFADNHLKNCKKVISFDECFTTEVGELPHQIKPTSICGQFLSRHPDVDIPFLINSAGIKPLKKHSEYAGKDCYISGTLLPFGEYLLMAFGKLNSDGRANITRKEYTDSLSKLWQEIDKYFNQCDVVIPVLGAGITRFKDVSLNQQQLVDVIIASYRLSPYKIKPPHKLRIICAKTDGFSLNKIGKSL